MLFSLCTLKKPHDLWISTDILQNLLHIVGHVVWKMVYGAFSSGVIDHTHAETLIVLIPKIDIPRVSKIFVLSAHATCF